MTNRDTFRIVLHVRNGSNPWKEDIYVIEAGNDDVAVRAAKRQARSEWSEVDALPVRVERLQ